MEGDYQVLVTVHSLVLLESRCAECYKAVDPFLRDSCCDGNNTSSCPDSCDVLLRFCQLELGDLPQFPLADRLLVGTNCVQNPLSTCYLEDWFGFNLKAGVPTYPEESLQGGIVDLFWMDVVYDGTGQWVNLITIIIILSL